MTFVRPSQGLLVLSRLPLALSCSKSAHVTSAYGCIMCIAMITWCLRYTSHCDRQADLSVKWILTDYWLICELKHVFIIAVITKCFRPPEERQHVLNEDNKYYGKVYITRKGNLQLLTQFIHSWNQCCNLQLLTQFIHSWNKCCNLQLLTKLAIIRPTQVIVMWWALPIKSTGSELVSPSQCSIHMILPQWELKNIYIHCAITIIIYYYFFRNLLSHF